jgi:hypothetical protein
MSFSQSILLGIWLLAFIISMLLVAHIWWSVHMPNAPEGFYAEIYNVWWQTAGLYAFVLTPMLGVAYARSQPPGSTPPLPIQDQLKAGFWIAFMISLAWNVFAIFFLWQASFWEASPGREMDIKSLSELLRWFEKLGWVVNPFLAFYFAHDYNSK